MTWHNMKLAASSRSMTKKAISPTSRHGTRISASVIAKAENIDMTPEHWEVVDFLREYYEEYQIAPAVRILVKEMKKKFGKEKGDQKASLRAVPLRAGQASLQNRRPAEADRLHLRRVEASRSERPSQRDAELLSPRGEARG